MHPFLYLFCRFLQFFPEFYHSKSVQFAVCQQVFSGALLLFRRQVLNPGETLEVGSREYMVRRLEPVYYGEEIAYYWGMCVEKGGEDNWGRS